MRSLKLQMQISVDGFVATGPEDPQDWVTWAWDEIQGYVLDLIDTTDTIVLGRKLAEGYIPHWEQVAQRPNDPFHPLATRIVAARKLIFSRTLEAVEWPNTEIVRGDLHEEIDALKRRGTKDLIVYGGSSFVSALIRAGLVDEFHLFVNPVALGRGVPIFADIETFQKLKLRRSIPHACGIVVSHYDRE